MATLTSKSKFQAFTIVETLVAMVLVLLSFGVGIMSFDSLSNGDQLILKSRATEIIDKKLSSILIEKKIDSSVEEIEGMTILSEAKLTNGQYLILIQAKNDFGLTISRLQTYIPVHEWRG